MLTGASIVVGLAGVQLYHFYLCLVLLGIGWNFGFVGASTLVLQCHKTSERNSVQALNPGTHKPGALPPMFTLNKALHGRSLR
jgi:hypothetical protein